MNPEEKLARRIVRELRQAGHEAFWVGGCVRDLLLGRPSKDFDVSTAAEPVEVQRLFPDSKLVGAAFGVVLVKQDDAVVEVATYRLDHEYEDGRRPTRVSFTRSAEDDVRRRDFTINGLLYDPVAEEVIDYVGGRRDLEAGLIRAIGDPGQRFAEDRLRMLRAVRFAARLGFRIEEDTLHWIQQHAGAIRDIAAERIREELNRILTEGGAKYGFELLDETGLLAELLPEVKAMQGVEQPPEYHPEGDVWTHTLLMLDGLPPDPSPTLAMGVLLHDVGKPDTFERGPDRIHFNGHVDRGVEIATQICRRLRYSNAETEQILALVKNHMRFGDVHRMRESTIQRFLRLPAFHEHLELHRLDCLSSHQGLDNYEFMRAKQAEQVAATSDVRPEPLVNGHDLIKAGYEPGPHFQEMLEAAEDAQLEGEIQTKQEGLDLIRRRFPREQETR